MRTTRPTLLGFALFLFACGEHEPSDDEVAAWEQAWEEQASGKADGARCSGVLVPDRSGFGKRVALTFDDGPHPTTTPEILDTLARHGIRATFFINGSRVTSDATRAIVQRIVREGHILANHTQEHRQMTTLGAGAASRQIELTHAIIGEVTQPRYFRFPFGASNCSTAELVRSFGLTVTGWHVDSADWCYASAQGGVGFCDPRTFAHVPDAMRSDMVGFTMQQTRSRAGGILLFHDIHANTASHLEPIIEQLVGEGFEFTNIDDLSTFPLLNEADDLHGWIGDACSVDDDVCAFDTSAGSGRCHTWGDEFGYCTAPCEGPCPDKSGTAPTFCTSLDGGISGSCVPQASPLNASCSTIPGTAAVVRERFVGVSGASAATATVCVPVIGPSCAGLCGTTTPAADSSPPCFCDTECVDNGDCCDDFDELCN